MGWNFFFFVSSDLNSVWIEIMSEWCFLVFWFFLEIFYRGFGRNGTRDENFFFSSSARFGLKYWPNDVFYFFEFLCFFLFEFSTLGRVGMEFESNFFFFHSYLANFIPVWIEMMPESCFFIFRIFLEFSCTGRVGTEFKTKFFFYFSRTISSLFG